MESYSLYQLNEYVRRVIALNFREPLWIEAEISQIKDSRGNHYLELIEKDDTNDSIIAQTSAVIWYRNYKFIEKKVGDILEDLLVDGTQVRIKCKVDFHERYGLKLVIEDIDPNFTFGKLELKRQEIINQLEEEGLMDLNKGLLVPTVLQKIAVISSSGAAGYQDFIKQLTNNSYGYTFKIDLYDSAVQGAKVSSDTVHAINEILQSKTPYDLVAIIRGGGSKLDLSGYDDYEISKAIALSDIPFVIGIGHEIDTTVVDLVSCISLKTPTAVADYIIERNMSFEARIENNVTSIYRISKSLLQSEQQSLRSLGSSLSNMVQLRLQEEHNQITIANHRIKSGLNHLFRSKEQSLQNILLRAEAVDPMKIMSQGYSIIKKDHLYINSAQGLSKGDNVQITMHDGIIDTVVTNNTKNG